MTADSIGLSQKEAEAAARACIVKYSRGRRIVIRSAELLLLPFVRVVDFLRSLRASHLKEIRKILVMESGNLGDIVAILPFLRNLRLQFPDVKIALWTNASVIPLMENLKLVDELIPARFPWAVHFSQWKRYNPFSGLWLPLARSVRFVKRQQFDLALCAKGDLRDNFILWLTAIPRRVGYGFLGGGFLMTERAMPDLAHPHRSDCWLRLLEHLGKTVRDRKPYVKLKPLEMKFATNYLVERGIANGALVIGIHAGARIRTRQWGIERFRTVAESLAVRFSAKILWFQDPDEKTSDSLPASFVPVSLPLRQFMAVLARCDLLICNDSGPLHIASALEVPTVSVFGPTEPAWFGPKGENNKIVINPAFWCRPCADRCIFDQPYCLRTISVEQVASAAEKVVATRPEVCAKSVESTGLAEISVKRQAR